MKPKLLSADALWCGNLTCLICRWRMLLATGTSCTHALSMNGIVAAARSDFQMVILTPAAHGRLPTRSNVCLPIALFPTACTVLCSKTTKVDWYCIARANLGICFEAAVLLWPWKFLPVTIPHLAQHPFLASTREAHVATHQQTYL